MGTDKPDKLGGKEGDDEVRDLGAADQIFGGVGKDVIYGGHGNDSILAVPDGQPDKLYCGKDEYHVEEKIDYVSGSCEKKFKLISPFGNGMA